MNENYYTYPGDDKVSGFTEREKGRWNRNLKKIQERLASTCKHLIKGKSKKKKRRKKKVPKVSFDDCTCVRETEKAVCVSIPDVVGDDVWIPKSVLHDDSEVFDGDEHSTGTLVVYTWWAEKEKLI